MSLLRPRIVDDRGRGPGCGPQRLDAKARAEIEQAAWTARAHAPDLRRTFVLVPLFFVTSGSVVLAFLLALLWPSTAVVATSVGAAAALIVATVVAMRWIEATYLVRACRQRHLCARCAYSLHGLGPSADDGCTLCPECGAAWRLQGEGTKGQRDEGTQGDGSGRR